MATLWTKNGESSILVNASGLPYLSSVCPEGLDSCYQITGYSDGDLSACDDCDDFESSAWDGTFPRPGGTCEWKITGVVSPNPSIDGKDIRGGANGAPTRVYLDTANKKWKVEIGCDKKIGDDAYDYYPIWHGEKASGQTPEGTYTRTSGCDTTSSLEIEACP